VRSGALHSRLLPAQDFGRSRSLAMLGISAGGSSEQIPLRFADRDFACRLNKNRRLFSPEIFSAGFKALPGYRKDQAAHLLSANLFAEQGVRCERSLIHSRCLAATRRVNSKAGARYLLSR
jgi:hypothetical protein